MFSLTIINEQEKWEVECIKEAKVTARGGVWFLVKWKNYSDKWNEWMSKKDLKNVSDIIKKFYEDYSNAPYWLQILDSDTSKPT